MHVHLNTYYILKEKLMVKMQMKRLFYLKKYSDNDLDHDAWGEFTKFCIFWRVDK